ncbi:MAG TPA: type II secretion system F family protein, partial [Anaerolineales bacterium]|nr:type II secretion system F family protein [Anaerolineales bacterium]
AEVLSNIRLRIWERKQLMAEAQKLSVLSFDFFFPASVLVAIVQNLFFPNSLNSVIDNPFVASPVFLLLIIWSLILLVSSAIRLRKEQLIAESGDRTGFLLVLHTVLLFFAFLTGVPQLICVWLAVILLSRSLLGLVASTCLWLFVFATYLFSIDIFSLTIKPDRMEWMGRTLESVGRFLAGIQPALSMPGITLPSVPALSWLVYLILFTLIAAVVLIVFYSGREDMEEDEPLQARLAEYIQRGDVMPLEEIELSQSFAERLIVPFLKRVGDLSLSVAPQGIIEDIEHRFELAGNPWPVNAPTFIFLRFVTALLLSGLLLALNMLFLPLNFTNTFGYILGAAFVGYFLPSWILTLKIKQRQTDIRRALPDSLDLLTICVDAGLSIDAAMSKVSEKWENELSLIFARTIREVQLGKIRREALRDMAERTGVPELKLFVASAIQSDQLGLSISRVLRSQGYELDVRLRDGILRELHRLDTISKISFFLLFGLVFVFLFLWPLLAQFLLP